MKSKNVIVVLLYIIVFLEKIYKNAHFNSLFLGNRISKIFIFARVRQLAFYLKTKKTLSV